MQYFLVVFNDAKTDLIKGYTLLNALNGYANNQDAITSVNRITTKAAKYIVKRAENEEFGKWLEWK